MADDIKVTIGGDATPLEGAARKAGKNVADEFEDIGNPFQGMADKLSTLEGIGGLIAGPIGATVGQFFDAFGGYISDAIAAFKELADYAQQIRRTALTTGLSISEIKSMEGFATAFGVSLESMAKAVVDFKQKIGEARIKGGELTNVLAKMGVGMNEVANGTFDHQKALKALAEAYEAGTDEATLLYYGTRLFGDSFKELLPMVKAGAKAIDDASNTYYQSFDEASQALGRASQDFDNLGRTIKNFFVSLVGSFIIAIEKGIYNAKNNFSFGQYNPFESLVDELKRKIANAPSYMTNEEIKKFVLEDVDEDKREEAAKEIDKQLKGRGRVLSPFGMAPALASQMQEMGGGDIFGAIAATPLDRIVRATEETAANTRPRPEGEAPATPTPVAR
jgi:methyl-accepting chemotaxis protein